MPRPPWRRHGPHRRARAPREGLVDGGIVINNKNMRSGVMHGAHAMPSPSVAGGSSAAQEVMEGPPRPGWGPELNGGDPSHPSHSLVPTHGSSRERASGDHSGTAWKRQGRFPPERYKPKKVRTLKDTGCVSIVRPPAQEHARAIRGRILLYPLVETTADCAEPGELATSGVPRYAWRFRSAPDHSARH